jgi:nucleoid-associated protein YgaU
MYARAAAPPLDAQRLRRRRAVAPWRVTVRRLVMVGACFFMFAVVLAQAAHGQEPSGYEQVSVRAGDTVWSIAAERYPGSDPRQKVDEILRANGLSGPAVYPGERLRVPAG